MMLNSERELNKVFWNVARGVEAGTFFGLPDAVRKIHADKQVADPRQQNYDVNIFFASALASALATTMSLALLTVSLKAEASPQPVPAPVTQPAPLQPR